MPLGCSFSTWTGETGVQSPMQAALEAPGSRGGSGGLSKCTFLAEGPSRSSLNFRLLSGTVPEGGIKSDVKQAVAIMFSLHRASVGPGLLKSSNKQGASQTW